jgi:hypothetical protein
MLDVELTCFKKDVSTQDLDKTDCVATIRSNRFYGLILMMFICLGAVELQI